MKLDSVGTIIATRELDLLDGGKVRVIIGKPQGFPGGGGYFCPYQIVGMGDENVQYTGGVDTVQALELGLKMIGVRLYSSEEFKAGRLRSEGRKNLGFPVIEGLDITIPTD